MVQKLKEEAELVSWQVKSRELGEPGQKRKKTYAKQDERIKRIMEEYDMYKGLKASSCIIGVNNVLMPGYVTKTHSLR